MIKNIFAGIAAVSMLAASPANASVTFDPLTGTGFVGKGDVQLVYGWNNAQLQSNASGVTFSFSQHDRYDVECEWTTTTGGPNPREILHDITVTSNTRVNSSIAYEARKNSQGQITGFNLTGLGTTTTSGTTPVVGGTCPGASSVGTIVDVYLVSSDGGLTVTYNGNTQPLQ